MSKHERVFQSALIALRAGRSSEAWTKLCELISDGSTDPRHLSLYGVLVATRERRVSEGVELCERALLLAPADADLLVNLARVHAQTGRKSKAIEMLRQGLRSRPGHGALRAEINRLSERRAPVLGRLHRDNVMNKVLGILRARLARRSAS